MLAEDKDALVCDMAETYGIFDFCQVPIQTLATLAAGLHEESRIKMRIAGKNRISPLFAYVRIADTLTMILHVLSAKKGAEMPELLEDYMIGKPNKKEEKLKGFKSIDEFEAARRGFING